MLTVAFSCLGNIIINPDRAYYQPFTLEQFMYLQKGDILSDYGLNHTRCES